MKSSLRWTHRRGISPTDLESETLDLKSDRGDSTKTLRQLAKAAACLANGRGGTLVLGVEDDREGSEAFTGTGVDLLKARRYTFETVDPPLTVSVDAPDVVVFRSPLIR